MTDLEIIKNYIDLSIQCVTKIPWPTTNPPPQLTEEQHQVAMRFMNAETAINNAIERERRATNKV